MSVWPNGWMDQHATWYGGRPRPRPHCVRWGPSSPQGGTAPIFGPFLLWPMGDGGGGHWLVQMEWRPAGWSMCLPLLVFSCTIKSRSSLLALAHPGGPRKRAVNGCGVVWWWSVVAKRLPISATAEHLLLWPFDCNWDISSGAISAILTDLCLCDVMLFWLS